MSSGYFSKLESLASVYSTTNGSAEEIHLRARVAVALDLGQVRRRDLAVLELLPVDLLEPHVREHVAGAVLQVAVALRRVALHELQDEVRRVLPERGPADEARAARDLLVQDRVVGVGRVVRREAGEHLEDEHAERVPVDTLVVPVLRDDLVRLLGRVDIGRWGARTSGAR